MSQRYHLVHEQLTKTTQDTFTWLKFASLQSTIQTEPFINHPDGLHPFSKSTLNQYNDAILYYKHVYFSQETEAIKHKFSEDS